MSIHHWLSERQDPSASNVQYCHVLLLSSSKNLQHSISDLLVLGVAQPEISSGDGEKE